MVMPERCFLLGDAARHFLCTFLCIAVGFYIMCAYITKKERRRQYDVSENNCTH